MLMGFVWLVIVIAVCCCMVVDVEVVDSTDVSCKGGSDGDALARASTTACGIYSSTATQCSSTSNAQIGSGTGSNSFNTFKGFFLF